VTNLHKKTGLLNIQKLVNHSIQTNFIVVRGTAGSLLGRKTAGKINLLCIRPPSGNDFINIVGDTYSNQIEDIITDRHKVTHFSKINL